MEKYNPRYYDLEGISLFLIAFNKEDPNVTLFGYALHENSENWERWDFLCDYGQLTEILMYASEKFDPVIDKLAKILSSDIIEEVSEVDIEELTGDSLTISNTRITVYYPHIKDDTGVWVEDKSYNCYFINNIINNQKSVVNDVMSQISSDAKILLEDHYTLLDNSFRYYLQLIDRDFTIEESRKRSGLTDELLFRIALLRNKSI